MGRKRASDSEAGPSKRPNQPSNSNAAAPEAAPQALAGASNRRQDMAQIARQRAAHFATWHAGDVDDNPSDNPHIGGETARSLGPWSSAVQLANAREAQRERRNEKLKDVQASGLHSKAKGVAWAPSRDPGLGPRPYCEVKSLFEIGLELVVEYIECVESLYGLPDMIKSRIAAAICRRRALSPPVFHLFCQHTPTELCIPDCSQLDPSDMEQGLAEAWSPRLQKLSLGLCGRGLTDATATALAHRGASLPALQSLYLSGAYKLGDASLIGLLEKMPGLVTLSLPQLSRVTGVTVEGLPGVAPRLEELDLKECRGVGKESLKTAFKELKNLKSVVLDGIPEVDDELISYLATTTSGSLERLSVCLCPAITDATLESLAAAAPSLTTLAIDECRVTTAGVQTLAQSCKNLHTVSLKGCRKLEDEGIKQLAAIGTLRSLNVSGLIELSDAALVELARWCRLSLEELDVSWCRGVSSEGLGLVADTCTRLKKVTAWGCTQLGDTFLYGHSNEELVMVGRGERVNKVMLPLQKM